MRTDWQSRGEHSSSGKPSGVQERFLSRKALVGNCIALLLIVVFVPALISQRLDALMGSYSSLSTPIIVVAIGSMFPIFLLVNRCPRPRIGAIAGCLGFALGGVLVTGIQFGFSWPPHVLMGWLMGSIGLCFYALIIGKLRQMSQQLEQANTTIQRQALTDALTGLPNHLATIERLDTEIERARRFESPFSLIFFDGDRFKHINDTYGHPAGNVVLRELSARVKESLRGGDILGRFGGEEFIALLPAADCSQATVVAERIRASVASRRVAREAVAGGIAITISVGVATFPADGGTVSALLKKADEAMYLAKRLGRNQVRTAQEMAHENMQVLLTELLVMDETETSGERDSSLNTRFDNAPFLDTLYSLMHMIELRDVRNRRHAYAVSDLATAIAQKMGQDQQTIHQIGMAALLHDIGKIAIPDRLLQEPDSLTPQEEDLLGQHPVLGVSILEISPFLHDVIPAVRHHHERWDGKGYPDGLKGESIPLPARIIAVADMYDALRMSPQQRSTAEALAELERCAGSRLDPVVVSVAIVVLTQDREWEEALPLAV